MSTSAALQPVKTAGVTFWMERIPIISFFYFAYFDDVPEEADISSIIGTIAVVAALMMTMVGATFAIVPYDDYADAVQRYSPGGVYGCIQFPGENETFGQPLMYSPNFPSGELAKCQVEALYICGTTLAMSVMLLFSMTTLTSNTGVENFSSDSGDTQASSSMPLDGGTGAAGNRDLSHWWKYMRYVALSLLGCWIFSMAWGYNVMATLMYLTMENRGLAQVCQNLGWTLLETDDNGNDVFNCTNPPQGDPLRCFVQVTMPFLGELSALDDEFASVGGVRGGKTELIAFHAMVSILAVIIPLMTVIILSGFAALDHQSESREEAHRVVSEIVEEYKEVEGWLQSCGNASGGVGSMSIGLLARVGSPEVANTLLKESGLDHGHEDAVKRAKIIALAYTPNVEAYLKVSGYTSAVAGFGFKKRKSSFKVRDTTAPNRGSMAESGFVQGDTLVLGHGEDNSGFDGI